MVQNMAEEILEEKKNTTEVPKPFAVAKQTVKNTEQRVSIDANKFPFCFHGWNHGFSFSSLIHLLLTKYRMSNLKYA